MREKKHGGRSPEGTRGVTVRMTEEEREVFRLIGGTDYLRRHLRDIAEGAPFTVRPRLLDQEGQSLFMLGIEDAGFHMKAFPFSRGSSRAAVAIPVRGIDPRQWGKQWAESGAALGLLKKD